MGYIKKLNFLEKNKDIKIVLSLGFFDAVHKGHQEIINKTVEVANNLNAIPTIFTFRNIEALPLKNRKKEVYDFDKRLSIYESLGIKSVIYADASEDFCSLEPELFFQYLIKNFNICAIVVGKDYKFGHLGKGDIKDLENLTKENSIELVVLDLLKLKDHKEKISSTYIKEKLKDGDIEEVNKCLVDYYSIKSKVVKGKQLGKQIGFPTANFELDIDSLFLKDGVYVTTTQIDCKTYYSITNVGNHPTTDNLKANVETYIFDFNEDIYGKEIKVTFFKRIRDIVKFNSIEELKERLALDTKIGKDFFENEKI